VSGPRVVCWFSAGAASVVATKLALKKYGDRVVIAYCDPGSEHPDNERFLSDCEKWFGREIIRLKSERYADTWEVWGKRRFLVGPAGALCTIELKKSLRHSFQEPDDIQVFGYTVEERDRAERFRKVNFEVDLWTPLIDENLTKQECLGLLNAAGIEIPAMYKLGYHNNNCVGCVKGGMGYWNKMRRDFPGTFVRMAQLERSLGATIFRENGEPLYLDALDPGRGNHATEPGFECSLLCQSIELEPVTP